MCSREVRFSDLSAAPSGRPLRVIRIARPVNLDDHTWLMSLMRLEELGVFPGQAVEKVGSPGQPGAVILKAGGSRVALSRELAGVVLVRPPTSS